MTRISNIFVASALAVLPISAFAQQDTVAAKAATPIGVAAPMAPSPTAPSSNKATAGNANKSASKTTQATKPDIQTTGSKSEVHGMNTLKSHNGKTTVPATLKPTGASKS